MAIDKNIYQTVIIVHIFNFSMVFLLYKERIVVSPSRRTTLSTPSTPTEVTSLGEFQPMEDRKGGRANRRNNNDLLYKPFPPTTTGFEQIIGFSITFDF